jgi:hypothetical protein
MFHGCLESIALLISKPSSTASSVAIIVRTTQDCGALRHQPGGSLDTTRLILCFVGCHTLTLLRRS